jgi:hypothetical protein
MEPEVMLDLPWVPESVEFDGVVVRRGPVSAVTLDDGIQLGITVLDPSGYESVEELMGVSRAAERPGQVVLIAGSIPLNWRGELRASGASWYDPSGALELHWPRLEVDSLHVWVSRGRRRRRPLALQQGHAVAAQVLLAGALGGREAMSVSWVAESACISLPSASRSIKALKEFGLVQRVGATRHQGVAVVNPTDMARVLADRTGWSTAVVFWGYLWGANPLDVAERLDRAAAQHQGDLAITGRAGASFMGVLGTGDIRVVRARLRCKTSELATACRGIGIEPAHQEQANVAVAADPWGLGAVGANIAKFEGYVARIASPLRIWCDVGDEPRGSEFAAQTWGLVSSAA